MSFRAETPFNGSVSVFYGSQSAKLSEVACAVLSVRTRPFAVPRGLLASAGVSCQVTDAPGNSTVSILVTKTLQVGSAAEQAAARSQQHGGGGAAEASDNSHQQQHLGTLDQSRPHTPPGHIDGALIAAPGFDAAAFTQHAAATESSSIIIQKVSLADPIVVWRCARYLLLANSISPHLCPNILPLIAAYRHAGAVDTLGASSANLAAGANTSNNINNNNNNNMSLGVAQQDAPLMRLTDPSIYEVYIAQPHVNDTLAAVARAAPCSNVLGSQIRTIARELLDALSFLHRNGIVVNDLTPSTIRVNTALRSRADVAIALSRPVLANTPMSGRRFLQLMDLAKYAHRYLAPEVVVQVSRAMTARAVAHQASADPGFFATKDSATVSVPPAADIFSLACVLVELVTGRPLFASSSVFEHGKVVAEVLGQPFPEKVPPPCNSAPSRVGVFTGVPLSSALQTALAETDASFRQLVAAMLQVDPYLRPTAEECVRSPFISLGIAGNIAGGSGGVRAHGGAVVNTRVLGNRRHSGTSSGSRPVLGGAGGGGGGGGAAAASGGGAVGAEGSKKGGHVARSGGGSIATEGSFDIAKDWAIPEPGEEALIALTEAAPLMP